MQRCGPFDAIMGFSQGATAAALISLLQHLGIAFQVKAAALHQRSCRTLFLTEVSSVCASSGHPQDSVPGARLGTEMPGCQVCSSLYSQQHPLPCSSDCWRQGMWPYTTLAQLYQRFGLIFSGRRLPVTPVTYYWYSVKTVQLVPGTDPTLREPHATGYCWFTRILDRSYVLTRALLLVSPFRMTRTQTRRPSTCCQIALGSR